MHLILHRERSTSVICQQLSAKRSEQAVAQKCLITIMSTLRFLTKAGLPIRGHSHNQGNCIELLQKRAREVPELNTWFTWNKNYLSNDI